MNRTTIRSTILTSALLALASTNLMAGEIEIERLGATLVSSKSLCTDAAMDAKRRALAAGIDESRMSWLYGIKPFEGVGHVSLVIDGKTVIDNGGLGRNLFGGSICPGNVCTVKEARRGYDESFMESATLVVRTVWPQDGAQIAKRR